MLIYLLKRLGSSLVVLFFVSIITFSLIRSQPGNPFANMISPDTDPAFVEERMKEMGYYDPLPMQYFKWLGRALHGDLGYSIQYKAPAMEIVRNRFGNTLLLSGIAFIFSGIFAIALGVFSAAKQNRLPDTLITVFSFIGISLPTFFVALLLLKTLSFDLGLLPPTGMITVGAKAGGLAYLSDLACHMIMPVAVLTITQASIILRYVRGSMIEVLGQSYIRTARSKGMGRSRTVATHGFRNALISTITVLCTQFPNLLSGAVITETVFVWPGIGRLNFDAILAQDYPLIMAITMLLALVVIIMNFLGDVLCALADPQIRLNN